MLLSTPGHRRFWSLVAFAFVAFFARAAEPTKTPALEKRPVEMSPRPASATEPKLAWDAVSKSYDAKPGENAAVFEFRVTNRSSTPVSIISIQTSCGCTVAELPPLPASPFILAAQASTSIRVTLDLTGKAGTLSKTVTVGTSVGPVGLSVHANIAAVAAHAGNSASMNADRAKNIEIATRDRQAIFKGDCAKCHSTPAGEKMGQDLYLAVCSICHDATPRASMIPDLSQPRGPRDLAFWNKWITEGGPGTMMPAFATTHDGPLSTEQVGSLALYLFATYSRSAPSAAASQSNPAQK